jgi:HNH endonuclease
MTCDVHHYIEYDPDTGLFRRTFQKSGPRREGWFVGSINDQGYAVIRAGGGPKIKAHRLAWRLMTGEWPIDQVDHINLDKTDNRWVNLRLATRAENMRNKGPHKNNAFGLKGVRIDPRKKTNPYYAKIKCDGVEHYLGSFATAEEAHAAYVEAARRLHGEFARAA